MRFRLSGVLAAVLVSAVNAAVGNHHHLALEERNKNHNACTMAGVENFFLQEGSLRALASGAIKMLLANKNSFDGIDVLNNQCSD